MLREEKGEALLAVLLLAALIFIVGGAAVAMGTTVRKTAAYEVRQKKAYYTAEAGVEKVLAKAKSDPDWLKDLPLGEQWDFMRNDLGGNGRYADGEFKQLLVKKTVDTATSATLEITSTGQYGEAHRTITATAEVNFVYSGNIFQGVWTGSLTGLKLSHGANLVSNTIASDGEIQLPAGSFVKGDIYSRVKVTLEDKKGSDRVEVQGSIYCAGAGIGPGEYSVNLGAYSLVTGDVYAEAGKVRIGSGATIAGKIYVRNADQLDQSWRAANPGKWEVVPGLDVASHIPQYPIILTDENLNWYKQNADHYYQGNVAFDSSDLSNLQGLYYIEGNATFSGEYSGRATFVVNGDVTFKKYSGRGKASFVRKTPQDIVTILSRGDVDTQNANGKIEALVYSQGGSDGEAWIKNKTEIIGAVVFPNLKSNGSEISFTYDPQMVDQHEQYLNWTTTFVKVLKWKEG